MDTTYPVYVVSPIIKADAIRPLYSPVVCHDYDEAKDQFDWAVGKADEWAPGRGWRKSPMADSDTGMFIFGLPHTDYDTIKPMEDKDPVGLARGLALTHPEWFEYDTAIIYDAHPFDDIDLNYGEGENGETILEPPLPEPPEWAKGAVVIERWHTDPDPILDEDPYANIDPDEITDMDELIRQDPTIRDIW